MTPFDEHFQWPKNSKKLVLPWQDFLDFQDFQQDFLDFQDFLPAGTSST